MFKKVMKKICLISLLGIMLVMSGLFRAPLAYADKQVQKISIVVNEELISKAQFDQRMDLFLFSSGLPHTAENKAMLKSEVTRSLIDESLQLSEGREKKIVVSDEEVNQGFNQIAQQNGKTVEEFSRILRDAKVSVATLKDQVRANMIWTRLMRMAAMAEIEIRDEEINQVMEELKASAGKPEYWVASIFLPVEKFDQEEKMKALSENLYKQIKGGAAFSAVAQQFSQSASALKGGDIGWIRDGHLNKDLDAALKHLTPGELSKPIRDAAGYHILLLRGKRKVLQGDTADIKISVKQLHVPYYQGISTQHAAELRSKAQKIQETVKGCFAFQNEMSKYDSPISGDMGQLKMRDLPDQIYEVLSNIPIGKVGPLMENETGILMLMVCSRDEPDIEMPSEDDVAQMLYMERIDNFQRRYIQDLRDDAFIDIRI